MSVVPSAAVRLSTSGDAPVLVLSAKFVWSWLAPV